MRPMSRARGYPGSPPSISTSHVLRRAGELMTLLRRLAEFSLRAMNLSRDIVLHDELASHEPVRGLRRMAYLRLAACKTGLEKLRSLDSQT